MKGRKSGRAVEEKRRKGTSEERRKERGCKGVGSEGDQERRSGTKERGNKGAKKRRRMSGLGGMSRRSEIAMR